MNADKTYYSPIGVHRRPSLFGRFLAGEDT